MSAQQIHEPSQVEKQKGSFLRIAAYAFDKAWINLVFSSTVLFCNYDNLAMPEAINSIYSTSIIALIIGHLLCAVFHDIFLQLSDRKIFELLGPIFAALGIVILLPLFLRGSMPTTLQLLISAVLTGFGSCITILTIGRRFARTDTASCIFDILLATAASSLLTLACLRLPLIIGIFIIIIFPFISVLCLHAIDRIGLVQAHEKHSLGERISINSIIRFGACALVLGILTGMLGNMYIASSGNFGDEFQFIAEPALITICIVLFIALRRLGNATISSLYRPVVLVCVTAFAVTGPFSNNLTVPFAIIWVGYSLFEALVWVMLSSIAHRFQYSSVQVFGYGRVAILLSGVVSGGIIGRLSLSALGSSETFAVFVAAAIVLIVILKEYVLTSKHLEQFEEVAIQNVATSASTAPQATDDNGYLPASIPQQKIPFTKRCAIIGEFYGFTPRETDVFCLLAVGRNSTRIQEELYISSGTVNTHSHHIFQKMGIHSQQELIDAFESADLDYMQQEISKR